MSKSPRKRSSPNGEMKLSIRFGQREEDGMMFMEYREENAKDVEKEARYGWCDKASHQRGENGVQP
jgi:hypothetical protein